MSNIIFKILDSKHTWNFVFCEACGIDPFFEFGYFLFDAEQILSKLVDLGLEIVSRHSGHEGATERKKQINVHV